MPQQPTVPRPAAERASTDQEQTAPATGMDLTVNKVLAGAGAAVTSAVLGSYFGATGTVAGAALGSVASTVATTLYQHSLDRTRDTLVARVRLSRGRGTDLSDAPTVQLTVPQPRVSPDSSDEATTQLRVEPASPDSSDQATTQLRVEPALRMPRRRIWLLVGATVLVFAIGMLAVTGLEWAKGSSLTTGQPGTSVGRVLTPATDGQESNDRNTTESDSEKATQSAEPTEEPTATAEPTSSAEPTAEATPTDGPDASAEPTGTARENERGSTATPRPTPENPIPDRPENN
jgi:hypothetical protein